MSAGDEDTATPRTAPGGAALTARSLLLFLGLPLLLVLLVKLLFE